jgi:galactokinase
MVNRADIIAAFQQRYGELPEIIVRAPLPVALLGEQVAGRAGMVLSLAVDRSYYIAASRRVDKLVRTIFQNGEGDDRFSLEVIEPSDTRPWANDVRGVYRACQARDLPLFGANLLLDHDQMPNNGTSTTAALTVGLGYTLQLLNHFSLLGEELALLALGAEQGFVGRQSSMHDHLVSALGQSGCALLIDCLDMGYRSISWPEQLRIVLCEVGTAPLDALAQQRREEAAAMLQEVSALIEEPLTNLRELEPAMLEQARSALSPELIAYAEHMIDEQRLVEEAATALEAGDLSGFGATLFTSHESLRDRYQLTTPEVDLLVELSHRQPGCYGARMHKNGGTVLCLVQATSVETFVQSIAAAYRRETGEATSITVCQPADGVSRAGSS